MVVKEEQAHFIDVIYKVKKALQSDDSPALKDLSNQTIHTASTAQDTDSIILAVVIYSLGKIIERKKDIGEKKKFSVDLKCLNLFLMLPF